MKRYISILLMLCMILALTGCGGSTSSGGSTGGSTGGGSTGGSAGTDAGGGAGGVEYKDTLTIGLSTEPILHPWQQVTMQDMPVARQVYDPLFRAGENGEVIPCLAESFEWVDDTHIQLNLRKGVKFHDGNEFTSKDVKYFFDQIPNNARYAFLFSCYDALNTEIVDDYTIIVPLNYPYIEGVYLMHRLYIPSSAAVEAAGGPDKFSTQPVGTGPFKMSRWDIGSEILLERFDDYWGGPNQVGAAATQFISAKIIPDSASRYIELETGGIDIAYDLSTAEFKRVEENADLDLIKGDSYLIKRLMLNMRDDTLSNQDLRYALSHAIDYEAINQTCFDGYYSLMPGVFANMIWGYKEMGVLEYNLDLAKEYMEKSGLQNVELMLLAQEPQDKVVAEAIQNMWAQIGVTASIMVMDSVSFEAQGYKYQASLERGSAPSLAPTIETYKHGAGLTLQPPDEGRMGDLVRLILSEYDETIRQGYMDELQQIVRDDRYVIPLAQGIVTFAINNKVENLQFEPFGAPFMEAVRVAK